MYLTLKSRILMKFIAQVILLLLIAFFTIIGTALLIAGTAHAADVTANGSAHYLMQKVTDKPAWENLGAYSSKESCERAANALTQRTTGSITFVCTKINY